jgi:hypothetical protein
MLNFSFFQTREEKTKNSQKNKRNDQARLPYRYVPKIYGIP